VIRRYGAALRAMLMIADATLAVITAVLVYEARFTLFGGSETPLFDSAWEPLAIYAATWVGLLYLNGQYRLRAHWTVRGEAVGIARTAVWFAAIVAAMLLAGRLVDASRLYLLLLFPIQAIVTIATRVGLRALFMVLRARGYNSRNLLIIGTGKDALEFARTVSGHGYLGLRIIGFVGPRPSSKARWPYLGDLSSFEEVLRSQVVDEVAICLPPARLEEAETISMHCQQEGKVVRIPLAVPHHAMARRHLEDFDGLAVLSLTNGPDQLASLAAKRVMDIVGSALALVILSPLLLIVALYILLRDGRPILFTQTRVGMHGRQFTLYKFRTMVRDAEARYAEIARLNETQGAAFKLKDDPRITRWGRFLRRTSIDELPQFWNVLKGDMSLVGPRPAPPREVDLYDVWHRRRLSMKPGLTGLWQISSRIDSHFDDRAKLDLTYIDRWSLWLDLKIVFRTLPAMLRLDGH
jgi:exopolysaccharide biosynthesis polyprenyl glycosylphosphotransferase